MSIETDKEYQILEQKLDALWKELAPYSEEILNTKPSPEAWSVTQILHHLMLSEKLSVAYCRKKLSFNPKLKQANWRTNFRVKMLKIYLNIPIKFPAPKGIGTEALPNHSTLSGIKNDWQAQRIDLKAFTKEIPTDILNKEVYKHPLIGRLTIDGMVRFFNLHFDRHHRQIKRTLKAVRV